VANQKEVAEFIGCSERTLRNWANIPGFPAAKGRGKLDVRDVVRWRLHYLEQSKTAQPDPAFIGDLACQSENELNLAEKRLKVEERTIVIAGRRFDLAVKAREFAPVSVITEVLELVSVALRANIESILPKIKRAWPDIPPEAVEVIKKVLAQCENEAADIEPDLSEFDPSDFIGGEGWLDPAEG